MGREIKFRVWRKSRSKYDNYWGLTFAPDPKMIEPETGPKQPLDDFILEQFTGLLDKNGKEIYEGDLVIGWHIMFPTRPAQVEFNKHYGKWEPTEMFWNRMDGITIIGNIHENPELLGERNEQD